MTTVVVEYSGMMANEKNDDKCVVFDTIVILKT